MIRRYGLPLAAYDGLHGRLNFAERPGHIQPPLEPTRFSLAVQELGIGPIFVSSPQSKNRIARIAGTFQNRLVSEFRLAGDTSIY